MLPTSRHFEVAHDAMLAAQAGHAAAPWYEKLYRPLLSIVEGEYRELLAAWEGDGWTSGSLATFQLFMADAGAWAGPAAWNESDLGVRYLQVLDDIHTGSDLYAAEDRIKEQIASAAHGVAEGAKDAMRNVAKAAGGIIPWYVWAILAVGVLIYVLSWLPRARRVFA